MDTTANPFTPRSKENPHGALYREVTVIRAGDGAPDGSIEIALSSEAPVERWDWMTGDTYLEVLDHGVNAGPDLSYAKDGLPFCMDHDIDDQIGLVENVRIDADRVLRGEVRQGNHPDAPWIFADMRAGIRKKVSIGYWPGDTYTQEKNAQGQIVRRYVGWTLYEASSVAIPADYEVGVGRSARGASSDGDKSPAAADEAHTTESTMDEKTPPAAGLAPAPDTRAADLSALAVQHNRTSDLPAWIREGKTVQQIKDLLLDELTARNNARPPVAAAAPVVENVRDRAEDKPFESLTDFLRSVKRAAAGLVEPRLAVRAATGMGIGTDSDGGFMVPEQFAEGVVTRAFTGGAILRRVKRIPIAGNQYHMTLIDETSRATGSRWGGVRGYRLGEGTAPTVSKPKTRRATLDVTKKIGVAVWASEEQLQDAPATDAILSEAMSQELTWILESEIWSGIGGAQCLGINNSGSLVTQAKVTSQTAATIVAGNATDMNARLWTGSHGSAAWFIGQMALGQLPQMVIGQQPVWLPPTGLVGSSPFGTLLGKPIEVVEYASVLGTVGDFNLFDLSQYAIGEKPGNGLTRSIHVKFLEGEEVFRQIVRVDGLPLWNSTLTLADGTTTVSPFITLATRA